MLIGGAHTLNVSGGTDRAGGWSDWVGKSVSLFGYRCCRSLKELAEHALSLEECAKKSIRETIVKESWAPRALEESIAEKKMPRLLKQGILVRAAGNTYEVGEVRLKHRCFFSRGIPVWKVKFSQVDWWETARANGVDLTDCREFNRIGDIETSEF